MGERSWQLRQEPASPEGMDCGAYLAAVLDLFSLTRTTWPGATTLFIRNNILRHLKEDTSSKMGDGGSMSESEDVNMTDAAQGRR